jgi:hypothetical protein
LQQQLIVGILAHGSIHEADLTAAPFEFLNHEHLMNVLASESVGSGDEELIKTTIAHLIT